MDPALEVALLRLGLEPATGWAALDILLERLMELRESAFWSAAFGLESASNLAVQAQEMCVYV